MNVVKPLFVGFITGLLMLTAVTGSHAADTTPMDTNPGPAGSFSWKGFHWQKRFWDGAPQVNRDFDAANVSNPDANGYVKLSITNPTGSAPVAAEFQSTREGFGYGTYTTTVEKNVSALQKEIVWGCLFTYDPNAAPSYTEIDLCEASAWGGGAAYGESWPVEQGHGYWFDSTKPPGQGNNTVNFPAPTSNILTHKMVWEPGRLTFETYAGEGYVGPLLKRTVLEGSTVPLPAKEQIHFNLWVTGGGGGDAAKVKPESVTIRDFSFTPANTLAPTGTGTGTVAPAPATSSSQTATPAPASPTPTVTPAPVSTATPSPSSSQSPPAPAPAPSPGTVVTARVSDPQVITLTGRAGKTKSLKTTTLSWNGAESAMVDLYINGTKRTVLNTGAYIVEGKSAATAVYQVCNAAGCSRKLSV